MIAHLPLSGGFISLGNRFVDPAFSFTMGWCVFFPSRGQELLSRGQDRLADVAVFLAAFAGCTGTTGFVSFPFLADVNGSLTSPSSQDDCPARRAQRCCRPHHVLEQHCQVSLLVMRNFGTGTNFSCSRSTSVWIAICLVVAVAINLGGTRAYGEMEFWFAIIKVLTIVGVRTPSRHCSPFPSLLHSSLTLPSQLIILGIILDAGGGPNKDPIGFRYWRNPGPFVQYLGIEGAKGRFLGFWVRLFDPAFSTPTDAFPFSGCPHSSRFLLYRNRDCRYRRWRGQEPQEEPPQGHRALVSPRSSEFR